MSRFIAHRFLVLRRTALTRVPRGGSNATNNSGRGLKTPPPEAPVVVGTTTSIDEQSTSFEATPATSDNEALDPIPTISSPSPASAQSAAARSPAIVVATSPSEYQGIAQAAFAREAIDVLMAPIDDVDVEIKPDGTVYMPEIKYRRRLNRAFGPGAWAMKPVGPAVIMDNVLSRTYQLFW